MRIIPLKYIKENLKDGIFKTKLDTWNDFSNFVCGEMLDRKHYIWRGQSNSDWLLESSLNRMLRTTTGDKELLKNEHLENFKYAVMGRRGHNPPRLKHDIDWWALGQHFGLSTPLLDWTWSPYVAAFFAFAEETNEKLENRAIYALNMSAYEKKASEIRSDPDNMDDIKYIRFYRPLTDENPRIVNQSGLFTYIPINVTNIEDWTKKNFEGDNKIRLAKILLPESQRETALKSLNRMNINYLTLFPDLIGASNFSNMSLKIENY